MEDAKSNQSIEPPILLKVEQAARLTSLGRSTLFKMIACGDLPAIRYGRAVRIRRSDLLQWIDHKAQEGENIAPAT
jgi:excisionase family DNA binding protein